MRFMIYWSIHYFCFRVHISETQLALPTWLVLFWGLYKCLIPKAGIENSLATTFRLTVPRPSGSAVFVGLYRCFVVIRSLTHLSTANLQWDRNERGGKRWLPFSGTNVYLMFFVVDVVQLYARAAAIHFSHVINYTILPVRTLCPSLTNKKERNCILLCVI